MTEGYLRRKEHSYMVIFVSTHLSMAKGSENRHRMPDGNDAQFTSSGRTSCLISADGVGVVAVDEPLDGAVVTVWTLGTLDATGGGGGHRIGGGGASEAELASWLGLAGC